MVTKKQLLARISELETKLQEATADFELRLIAIEDMEIQAKLEIIESKLTFAENQKPKAPAFEQVITEWINGKQDGEKQ